MLRSLTSGEVIDRRWTRFSFRPPALRTCCGAGLPAERPASSPTTGRRKAVERVKKRRHQNGRWPLNGFTRSGRSGPLRPGSRSRQGSRWNILRAFACWTGMELSFRSNRLPVRSGRGAIPMTVLDRALLSEG